MWLLRRLSLPHLMRHRARTLLTVLGIAMGVGAVVGTTSVSEAVFRSFRRTLEATGGRSHLHVSNGSGGVPEALVDEVRGIPGVAGAAALVEGFVGLPASSAGSLAIYGLDLLGSVEHEIRVPRDAVHVPDEILFVSRPDSVALGTTFADANGLREGSTLDVSTPHGRRTLVVRGTVDAEGPAALFDGAVALMDLPAAQRLLGKEGKVDRIDVRLDSATDQGAVAAILARLARGVGRVETTAIAGARAEDLLFSVHVALNLAGLIAAVVGFFLIFHTVAVSVAQRRAEITLLAALGHSAGTILYWLALEAIIVGTAAVVLGVGIGAILGRIAIATFGGVASAWLTLPTEPPNLTATGIALATAIGLVTPVVAALGAAWSFVTCSPAEQLRRAPALRLPGRRALFALYAAAVGLATTAALLLVVPRTLPYGQLLTFIFSVNSLAIVSFALLAPIVAIGVGHAGRTIGYGVSSIGLFLASRSLLRRPTASTAVVAAVVTGVGWTLAFLSLVASLESSWLGWLDEHFRSDLVVSAGTATVSLLTYPPVEESIVDGLRSIPGVAEVQAIRSIEGEHEGRAVVVMALDPASHGLPITDGEWDDLAGPFWSGLGVLVSENLAHKAGLARGQDLALRTPSGAHTVRILGVFADFQNGGDLGCIALSRGAFREWWDDRLITRARLWLSRDADISTIRAAVESRYGDSHGLHALSFAQARAGVAELIRSCFAISNALAFIALVVSFAGVVNFLLAAVLDRTSELRVLNCVGVTPGQIGAAVVDEGSLIGSVGAAAGVVAGVGLSAIIVLHSVPMVNGWRFAWRFSWPSAAVFAAAVVVLGAGAGIGPARHAIARSLRPPELRE